MDDLRKVESSLLQAACPYGPRRRDVQHRRALPWSSGDPAERLVPRLQPILCENLTMRLIRAIASEPETRSSAEAAPPAARRTRLAPMPAPKRSPTSWN